MTWKILLQNSLIFLNFSFEKLNIKALFLLTIKISVFVREKYVHGEKNLKIALQLSHNITPILLSCG